nr:nudix hydrolase 14, chloroplastic-like [Arachis hypogaea]
MSQLWWFGLVFVVFHCRNAIDSSLFKQWLHNLQSEIGILADGTLALRQVLIQGVDMFGKRIGFLKFKADIYKPVYVSIFLC